MTYVDGLLLVVGDGRHHVGDLVGQVKWNVRYAVFVAVDQLAGGYGEAADANRYVYLNQVRIGVGHGDVLGEELEPQLMHLVQVPDGAVGGHSHRSQGFVYIALHLAPIGADGRIIDVMENEGD